MAAIAYIPPSERVPFLQKIMFSAGVNTDTMASSLLTGTLFLPYFNIGMGLSPTSLSIVLMILFSWNAFCDPMMGNLSDNTRTRWGRRRPFMAVGAVLTGCLFPLFWFIPPALGETGKLVYLTAIGVLYYSCFSMWSMPYYGLQMELTPNYDERTRLTSWMALFGKISVLGTSWVMALVTGPLFINPVTGRGDIVIGMKSICWFIGGVIMFGGLLPVIFLKERNYEAEAKSQPRDPFWKGLKESASCGSLWSLIGIAFFMIVGVASVSTLGGYVHIYYLFDGNISSSSVFEGYKGTVLVITGVMLLPIWTWLGEKFDKKTVLMWMVIFTMFGQLLLLLFLRKDHPYLALIPAIFSSGAISAVWLFIPSMKADTADADELQTNRRREGSLNSFFSLFVKASITCATGMGGFMLESSGFSSKLLHQTPEVLHRMVMFYLWVPIGFWVVALVIAYFYPLSRGRMAEIRAELDARRALQNSHVDPLPTDS